MATQPTGPRWFELSRSRVAFEVDLLTQRYPEVDIKIVDGELHFFGSLRLAPDGVEAVPLEFDLVCLRCFPACAPKVKVISPDLSQEVWGHTWHLLSESNICFVRPNHWDVSFSVADVLDKVGDWYFNYLAVKHGLAPKMPDVGRVQLRCGGEL